MKAAVHVELPQIEDEPELFIRPSLVLDEAALEILAEPLMITRLSDSFEPDPPMIEAERLTWMEICAQYSGDWVLLAEIEREDNHWSKVRTARVIEHDRSVRALLDRSADVSGTTLLHTHGRSFRVTPGVLVEIESTWSDAAPKDLRKCDPR